MKIHTWRDAKFCVSMGFSDDSLMKTHVLDLGNEKRYRQYIEAAAHALRMGKVIAFPTETVYGLGAHRDNPDAIERIFEAKQRPEEKKLTLMIADRDDITKYVRYISHTARKLMDCFWPGPLSIIFPIENGADISVRLPGNTAARDLIRAANIPVLTTSANTSGRPPAIDAQQVLKDLGGKIPIILDGGTTRYQAPSTIIKVIDDALEIVRQGIIEESTIRSCLANTMIKV